MIIPDGTQEIAEDVIEKWRQVMKPIQKNSEIPVSASVGYAVGKYENIMELIEIADQRMYTVTNKYAASSGVFYGLRGINRTGKGIEKI
ncbi:MAG: hypothetical protein ACLTC8_01960 [Lachnospiraceae bacterium]